MPRELDWWRCIDRRAALREQFPPLSVVKRERPGTERDRANRALFAAENRASLERARTAVTVHEADANRFIAEMQKRKQKRFLAQLAARQERKTA